MNEEQNPLLQPGRLGPAVASDQLFRLVFDSTPNGLIMADGQGRIVLCNSAAERLFGYTCDELLGKSVDVLVPPRFRSHHSQYREGFSADPHARPMGAGRDLFGLRKDGSEVPIEIGLNPIRSEKGLFVLSSIVDITERRKMEQRFRLVVESSPNALVMVNDHGEIVLVNSQAESLFGYGREELLGKSVEMLVPVSARARHPQDRDGFFHDPKSRPMGAGRDLYGLRKDGSQVPVEIGLNPITTAEGTFVLSSIIDITERKRAEKEIRAREKEIELLNRDLERRVTQRTRELKRSNEELERFAYVASHDLREPLRTISNFTTLLSRQIENSADDTSKEYMRLVVSSAKRMNALIEGLLAFSRISRGEMEKEDIDLNEIFTGVTTDLSGRIHESQAQVTSDPLPPVYANRTLIAEVFGNLIGNALKFRGQDPLKIHVSAEREIDFWRISIRDNGIGIAPEFHGKIFDLYTRLHNMEEYEGTGMGLTIAKKIIERHGGHIAVESAERAGAVFSFTLPDKPEGERDE